MAKTLVERFPPRDDYNPELISYTMLSCWKRCHFKWWLQYMLKLAPKSKRIKMERGSYIHELLRAHYAGEDVKEASNAYFKKVTEGLFEEEEVLYLDMKVMCEKIMEHYISFYGKEMFNVIAAEDKGYASIPTSTGRPSRIKSYAKVDMVAEDERGIWIWEHKLTDGFDGRAQDAPFDPQLIGYNWNVMNMFWERGMTIPIAGVILNMLNPRLPEPPALIKNGKAISKDKSQYTTAELYEQTVLQNGFSLADYQEFIQHLKDNPRPFFSRVRVSFTPKQLDTYVEDLREATLEMLNRRNIFRNYNFMCKRDCGFCDICNMDMAGADCMEYIKRHFTTREDAVKGN